MQATMAQAASWRACHSCGVSFSSYFFLMLLMAISRVLAMRLCIRVVLHALRKPVPSPPNIKKGGRAPIGAPFHGRARRSTAAVSAETARLSALHRGARQGGRIHHWLSSSTALPETRRIGCYPLQPVSSQPRSAETGRSAGRAGTQSRPGAACETARGHRTRSTF